MMTQEELISKVNSKAVGNDVSAVPTYVTEQDNTTLLPEGQVRLEDKIYDIEGKVVDKINKPEPIAQSVSMSREEYFSRPYDKILEQSGNEYVGEVPLLDPLIPAAAEKFKPAETTIWEDIKVGAEVGSPFGSFISNRELYDSNAYNTATKPDPDFSFQDPEVVALLNSIPTELLTNVEEAVSKDSLELIIERNRYDKQLQEEYNEAGGAKYVGLVAGIVGEPMTAIPLAGPMKFLNSMGKVGKYTGYGAVGATFGVTDTYIRGSLQQTETMGYGSSAFFGAATFMGLGAVSSVFSKSINKSGAADSLLDPKAAEKSIKTGWLDTPSDTLQKSGSAVYTDLGNKLNSSPLRKAGELVEETAIDVKYNVQNIGMQTEVGFKAGYQEAIGAGYKGTYDDFLGEGLDNVISNIHSSTKVHTPASKALAKSLGEANKRLREYLSTVLPKGSDEAAKLLKQATKGFQTLTRYYNINTKNISQMSKGGFMAKVKGALSSDVSTKYTSTEVNKILNDTYDEIIVRYTRGDTDTYVLKDLDIIGFTGLSTYMKPTELRGVIYSDASVASHLYHMDLSGRAGLASKGIPLRTEDFKVYLQQVANKAIQDGASPEQARMLSTTATDLYRSIRGDLLVKPQQDGFSQAVKGFNNLAYSAVSGSFGLNSILDITVGSMVNGFKSTFSSVGPAIKIMNAKIKAGDNRAIQEAIQLGAGGEMYMNQMANRFHQGDGLMSIRTLDKTIENSNSFMEKSVLLSDKLANFATTASGIRHISGTLEYTAMYAHMQNLVELAGKVQKGGVLSTKELAIFADKGLTVEDLMQIPLKKVSYHNGKPTLLNIREWGKDSMELQRKIVSASNRAVNQAVIKGDVQDLPMWYHTLGNSTLGSMISVYTKYIMASNNSILRRGITSDKARLFQGALMAGGMLAIGKVLKDEALVAAGVIDESDRKYRIYDSRGNLKEDELVKLAIETLSFIPQLGAVSLIAETGLTAAGIDKTTGEATYSGTNYRVLGNLNNVLNLAKTAGGLVTGETDALDALYTVKGVTPLQNMWMIDQLYMPSLKKAVE